MNVDLLNRKLRLAQVQGLEPQLVGVRRACQLPPRLKEFHPAKLAPTITTRPPFPHVEWIRREAAPQGAIALAASIADGIRNGHSNAHQVGRGGWASLARWEFFSERGHLHSER